MCSFHRKRSATINRATIGAALVTMEQPYPHIEGASELRSRDAFGCSKTIVGTIFENDQ